MWTAGNESSVFFLMAFSLSVMDAAIADGPSALRGLVTGRANLCDTAGNPRVVHPSLPPPPTSSRYPSCSRAPRWASVYPATKHFRKNLHLVKAGSGSFIRSAYDIAGPFRRGRGVGGEETLSVVYVLESGSRFGNKKEVESNEKLKKKTKKTSAHYSL